MRGVLLVALLACSTATPPPTDRPACPSASLIKELHAVAFYFQQGPTAVARDHLARAHASALAGADGVSRQILARLDEVSRRIDTDAVWAQTETEQLRLAFGDWPCLPETMHRRFHAALPPIP